MIHVHKMFYDQIGEKLPAFHMFEMTIPSITHTVTLLLAYLLVSQGGTHQLTAASSN